MISEEFAPLFRTTVNDLRANPVHLLFNQCGGLIWMIGEAMEQDDAGTPEGSVAEVTGIVDQQDAALAATPNP
jgi:hypothetical protein